MKRKIKNSIFKLYKNRCRRIERKRANKFIEEQRKNDLKLLDIKKKRIDQAVEESLEVIRHYHSKVKMIEKLFRDVENINLSKLKIEHHAASLFQELQKMRDIADYISSQASKNKIVGMVKR